MNPRLKSGPSLAALLLVGLLTSCVGKILTPTSTGGSAGGSTSGGTGGRTGQGSGGANAGTGGGIVTGNSGGSGTGTGGQTSGAGGSAVGTGGNATPTGGTTTTGTGGGKTGGTTGTGGSTGTGGATTGTCPPACGPTADQLYDNKKLATIRITFESADTGSYTPAQWLDLLWSKWNHCPPFDASDLTRVTMQYESPDGVGNVTMKDVGMRIRGSMVRNYNQLQGFKLDFQKLLGTATGAARRRFGDVNRLNTLSIEKDPTHMVQCAAYQILRDFGLPAPYCNHLKVYVNGTYYGLMENVEEPETGRFQAHHFGTTSGETYEASPSQGDCTGSAKFSDSVAKLLYSGDTFSSYTSQYKITRGSTANAEAHLIPMLKCGDATATASDATFKTCIAEWIDVNQWLKQIAAESLIPTVESFMVERNYLLYFVPDSAAPHGGRFQLSSWDLDVSFNKATCYPSSCEPLASTASYFGPGGTRAKLATRLTTVFRTEYCKAMRDFISTAYKPATIDAMSAVIQSGMTNDPTTPMATWQSEVTKMRDFVTSHATSATTQINTACP